jgi:spoIIIJ-associated protein
MEEIESTEQAPQGTPTEETSTEARSDEDDLLDDQADAAEDFLNGLLDQLDMDGEAEADFEGDTIIVRIDGPDMGLLIGRHGATLEALQELTRAAVQHATSARAYLNLDIEGYRERQRERLEERALRLAEKVKTSQEPVEMDPMSSYERKVVHDALADFDGVVTGSEGEDPDRRVVIRPG